MRTSRLAAGTIGLALSLAAVLLPVVARAASIAPALSPAATSDAGSTITLVSGVPTSLRGDLVPYTVTVTPALTGDIFLTVGGSTSVFPADADGSTSVHWTYINAGDFDIQACLVPTDGSGQLCSNVVTQHVITYTVTTTLTIQPSTLYLDEPITFKASVSSTHGETVSVLVRSLSLGSYRTIATIPIDVATGLGQVTLPAETVSGLFLYGQNIVTAVLSASDHFEFSATGQQTVYIKRDASSVVTTAPATVPEGTTEVNASAVVSPVPPEGTLIMFQLKRSLTIVTTTYVQTDATGHAAATLKVLSGLAIGNYEVWATYPGGTRIAPSTGTAPVQVVDGVRPTVTWSINGTPSTAETPVGVSSRAVTINVTASDGTGSQIVTASFTNDGGATWISQPFSTAMPWTLTPGDGLKSVVGRVRDAAGNWSLLSAAYAMLDGPPDVTGVANRFATGAPLDGTKLPVTFTWTGVGDDIVSYEVAVSVDGGAYASAGTTGASSLRVSLRAGHTYRARVRATDAAAHVGAWATGSSFRVRGVQESSSAVRWSSGWGTASSTAYWGGATRRSTTKGAATAITFTGRSFAWVSALGPTRGSAKVYVNGTYVTTVSLYAQTTSYRQVVFTRRWTTAAERTIRIVVSGTAGHARVDVDGFAIGS